MHSTNLLERLNKEVNCSAQVVGIFRNEVATIRLIGAVLLEQNAPQGRAVDTANSVTFGSASRLAAVY